MNVLAESASNFAQISESIQGWFQVFGGAGKYILALVIFLIGKFIAKGIGSLTSKALGKTELDNKLAKYVGSEGSSVEKTIGGIVHGFVLLFVLLFALDIAGLDQVTQPLREMFGKILNFLPNIIGAAVILFVGIFLAKIVRQLVVSCCNAARLDARLGNTAETPIADALGVVLFSLVLLFVTPAALDALGIEAISKPIGDIVKSITGAVPNILLAGVLLAIGVLVAQIAQKLIKNLLLAGGVDSFPAKVGLNVPTEGSRSVSSIVSFIVFLSLIVIIGSTALSSLKLPIISDLTEGLVPGYLKILLALLIFGGGLLASRFAYDNLADKNITLAKVAKYTIIFLTSMVAIQRTEIAGDLFTKPYEYALVAAAVALGLGGAISIGLGGKDFVNRWLSKKG